MKTTILISMIFVLSLSFFCSSDAEKNMIAEFVPVSTKVVVDTNNISDTINTQTNIEKMLIEWKNCKNYDQQLVIINQLLQTENPTLVLAKAKTICPDAIKDIHLMGGPKWGGK